MAGTPDQSKPLIGVLALQGAFEEHQACLEAAGCRTVQVGSMYRLVRLCRAYSRYIFGPLDSHLHTLLHIQ
jgi:hypothetical protein